jgi:glutamine synthetase
MSDSIASSSEAIDETKGQIVDLKSAQQWLQKHGIQEVECLIPDMAGIPRGKIVPSDKFVKCCASASLRIAESLYAQDVKGQTIDTSVISELEPDVVLTPDLNTLRLIPWREKATASVICDASEKDGTPHALAPRQVLKKVIADLADMGLKAIVAPEFEFYLSKPLTDPSQALERPNVRSGALESGAQTYGMDILRDYSGLIDEIYQYCAIQGLAIDALTHEAGPGQFEINIEHGEALDLADQVFMFKRAAREACIKHGLSITFMAKPVAGQPGNAMHVHQSILNIETGKNIFSNEDGSDSEALMNYIAGLQKHIPEMMPFFAPYVNSYRRFVRKQFAPINTHWGHENRTVGLRIPESDTFNRRVENRVIGADANPYLALAATIGAGLLGLKNVLQPQAEMLQSAYDAESQLLPEHILVALSQMEQSKDLSALFGDNFLTLFSEIKRAEYQEYQNIITPWERENLLTVV